MSDCSKEKWFPFLAISCAALFVTTAKAATPQCTTPPSLTATPQSIMVFGPSNTCKVTISLIVQEQSGCQLKKVEVSGLSGTPKVDINPIANPFRTNVDLTVTMDGSKNSVTVEASNNNQNGKTATGRILIQTSNPDRRNPVCRVMVPS